MKATAHIRLAQLSDAAKLAELYQVAWEVSEEALDLSDWIEHGGVLVLEMYNGQMISALRWRANGEGWRLEPVATLPSHRGNGYGRWLITQLEAMAIKQNIPTLKLTLDDAADRRLPYYQRLGYHAVHPKTGKSQPGVLYKRVGGTWQYQGQNQTA